MKILKIFGVVVGIHLFALIFIFASPGCSSTSKPTPAPVDTLAKDAPPPSVNVPYSPPLTVTAGFNPDAPATASSLTTGSAVFRPTRPGSTAAQAVTAAPVTDVTPTTTYTVKAGDTLWELGKKFKIPYAEIAAVNSLKSSAPLHAGQKLLIPSKSLAAAPAAASATKSGSTNGKAPMTASVAATSAPASAASSGSYKHTVALGESLSSIALKYGVSVKELGTANNISDPAKVRAGAELVIPGWTAAGGVATKGTTKSGRSSTTPPAPAAESKPVFNLLESPQAAPNAPPVIKVEESPLSPKGN